MERFVFDVLPRYAFYLFLFLLAIVVGRNLQAQEVNTNTSSDVIVSDDALRIELSAATRYALIAVLDPVGKTWDESDAPRKRITRYANKVQQAVRTGDTDKTCAAAWRLTHYVRDAFGHEWGSDPIVATDRLLLLVCSTEIR